MGRKNSPVFSQGSGSSGNNNRSNNPGNSGSRNGGSGRNGASQGRSKASSTISAGGSGGGGCPGNLQECIDVACVPLESNSAYGACVSSCGKRCGGNDSKGGSG